MLAFYELVDPVTRSNRKIVQIPEQRFIQFQSDELVDPDTAAALLDAMRNAAGQDPETELAYVALIEGLGNAQEHAYPANRPPQVFPPVSRWWAAGSYDPAKHQLEFVVYDQGAGIPVTLPWQPFFPSVLRLCAPARTDADLIAAAIRYGHSRHVRAKAKLEKIKGRGNGLWTICALIPELKGSVVRIVSGHGEVTVRGHKHITKTEHSTPFCGTLLHWTLKLPPAPESPALVPVL